MVNSKERLICIYAYAHANKRAYCRDYQLTTKQIYAYAIFAWTISLTIAGNFGRIYGVIGPTEESAAYDKAFLSVLKAKFPNRQHYELQPYWSWKK